MDLLDHQDNWDHQVNLDQSDHPVLLALLDLVDLSVARGLLVALDNQDNLELQDKWVHLDQMDHLVQLDQQDLKDHKDRPVQSDLQDKSVLLARLGLWDHRVLKELKDLKEVRAELVQQVQQDPWDH